ncbi:MAG: hypothetical protein AB8B56_00275 [Crocinitomicaceae bacterium]
MKKLLTFSTILMCTLFAIGQTDGEAMIKSVYGDTEYNQMLSSNPGKVELLEKYALYGFHVVPINDKYTTAPELTQIPLRSKSSSTISIQSFLQEYTSGNFNPLSTNLFPGSESQVYRLQGVNLVIVIDNQSSILAH